jgi:hypothetical protein
MVKLVEARGLRHVDQQFALATLAMAEGIFAPDGDKVDHGLVHSLAGVWELFENFNRIPTPVFTGTVALIETSMRAELDEIEQRPSQASGHEEPGVQRSSGR